MSSDKYQEVGRKLAMDAIRNGIDCTLRDMLREIELGFLHELTSSLRLSIPGIAKLLGSSRQYLTRRLDAPASPGPHAVTAEEIKRFLRGVKLKKNAPIGAIRFCEKDFD